MKAVPTSIEHFDFNYPDLETMVRVEVHDSEVTIWATRDTFSLRRKEFFIHELASEGFIPEVYSWLKLDEAGAGRQGVRWVVDTSWPGTDPEGEAKSHLLAVKLVTGAALTLTVLLILLFSGHLGHMRVSPPATTSSGQ